MKLNKADSIRELTRFLEASKSSILRWLRGERIPREHISKLYEMNPEEESGSIPNLIREGNTC